MNRFSPLLLAAALTVLTGFAGRDVSSYSDADLAQMYAARGQSERALAYFAAAVAKEPDSPEPYLARAFYLLSLNRREDALRDLDRAIALQPGTGQHYVTRGLVYTDAGRKDLAEQDFTTACHLGEQSGCTFAGK